MSSTLTVIALIARLKESAHTASGDAMYREKISNTTPYFGFKQFSNARHEYNEAFKEGDLVLLGGKFTIDNKKMLVNIFVCTLNNNKVNIIILIIIQQIIILYLFLFSYE